MAPLGGRFLPGCDYLEQRWLCPPEASLSSRTVEGGDKLGWWHLYRRQGSKGWIPPELLVQCSGRTRATQTASTWPCVVLYPGYVWTAQGHVDDRLGSVIAGVPRASVSCCSQTPARWREVVAQPGLVVHRTVTGTPSETEVWNLLHLGFPCKRGCTDDPTTAWGRNMINCTSLRTTATTRAYKFSHIF